MKVYMVIQRFSDYNKTVNSYLNKSKAQKLLNKIRYEYEEKYKEKEFLSRHRSDCKKDECEECNKYFELKSEIYDYCGCIIREIEVEE